jgi:hypothetical protein
MHEEADPQAVRNDGLKLGRVVECSARRWNTPLAIPLMDLRLEKIDLLSLAGIPQAEAEPYHFPSPLQPETVAQICNARVDSFCAGSTARNHALTYIRSLPDLLPIGMAIGPYSLTTRLMADPISATALAGSGVSADEYDEVKLLLQCLRMAEAAVLRYIHSQITHGARAIMICEPAACRAYLSPRQIKAGSTIFEQFVMQPNLRIHAAMDEAGCDLIFHNCGELIDPMVEAFAHRLHPVILSLGSSRTLWNDALLVPPDVVLYGNLPTRSFYSDGAMPLSEVIQRTEDLVTNMRACGHPFILGSECDVLFVAEAQSAIAAKVNAMMQSGMRCHTHQAAPSVATAEEIR